ncbi:MAG: metal ABC transporter substrate-binding protein [Oligoflexia bacterium]|nr:metal ABC transporter substrate-binding protein [Oligoflexia bacterium]
MKKKAASALSVVHVGLVSLALLTASSAEAKLTVVTTLPSLADIAQNVGGEEVEAASVTKGLQDPHFIDPRPDLVLRLNRADLLVHVGLGLEDGWLPPLLVGSRNAKIQTGASGNFEASSVIPLKDVPAGKIDRSMGDVHPGGNPHFMLDPHNGILIARALAKRLGQLRPEKAVGFNERADRYVKELETRIKGWETALKPFAGRLVATYHKSWTYLSSWLKLEEAGTIEPKPGIPPSPEHVVKLIGLMREKGVKLILIEPYYPRAQAENVAQKSGARLVTLPTEVHGAEGVKSYFGVFDAIVRELQAVK